MKTAKLYIFLYINTNTMYDSASCLVLVLVFLYVYTCLVHILPLKLGKYWHLPFGSTFAVGGGMQWTLECS